MRHQEPLAKMADMWRERCHKAERERDLARRDYECMNKFREHAEDHLDQIRDALVDAVSGLRYIREQHGDLYGVGWDRVEAKARAALKATEEGYS